MSKVEIEAEKEALLVEKRRLQKLLKDFEHGLEKITGWSLLIIFLEDFLVEMFLCRGAEIENLRSNDLYGNRYLFVDIM